MEQKFNVGDCVQLIHGASPFMTVQKVEHSPLENEIDVTCTWYDQKTRKPQTHIFKEQVLKNCPQQADVSKIIAAFRGH